MYFFQILIDHYIFPKAFDDSLLKCVSVESRGGNWIVGGFLCTKITFVLENGQHEDLKD